MISPRNWRLIGSVLDMALEMEPGHAERFADRACSADPELRGTALRLVSIMRSDDGTGFLDVAPAAFAHRVVHPGEAPGPMDDEILETGRLGPYQVVRRLGRGGMGVVYLAHDPRLDRFVALKVLPTGGDDRSGVDGRLMKEARAASALDHPNVGAVYDVGVSNDGRPYIAMAFYEGETLRERIRRGPLSVPEAVDLGIQLGEGLGAAHRRGIVHRDVKPANVVLTSDGVAKIVDFGIATGEGEVGLGEELRVGTVAYMSPEQTRGSRVDGRADVWSLGVVLYEMLVGRRPFDASDAEALRSAIREESPPPLSAVLPGVPPALERVVRRCLEKDPAARYPDAGALTDGLRAVGEASGQSAAGRRPASRPAPPPAWTPGARGLLGLLVVAVATTAVLMARPGAPSESGDAPVPVAASAPRRLAVLPLRAGRADAAPYVAEDLTQEFIERLSMLGELRIIAYESVARYASDEATIDDVARDLGVGAVLLGTIDRAGAEVRITTSLVDASSGRALWAGDFTTALQDLPAVVAEVATEVTAALGLRAGREELRGVARRGTDVAEAYDEYRAGRYYLAKLDLDGTREARVRFERALDLDPGYADAWSGIAGVWNQSAVQGLVPAPEAGPRAREAAERALALDPELPEAHAHLGAVLGWYYGDVEGAERHFGIALDLQPASDRAFRHYAVFLRDQGRFGDALEVVHEARAISPLSPGGYAQEGMLLYFERRYDAAIEAFERLLALDPGYGRAHIFLAHVRSQTGEYEEALQDLVAGDPTRTRPDAMAFRGYVLGRLGRRAEALEELARLESVATPTQSRAFRRAVVHLGLGEIDRAFELLEQAVAERTYQVRVLKWEPVFDPLRSDDRYRALLASFDHGPEPG